MKAIDSMTVETLLAHSDFVRGLARAILTEPADADDAAQLAWLELCERPPRHTESPRGWLATVTRQAARKIRRGQARRDVHEAAAAETRPEPGRSAAEIVEKAEAQHRLIAAVLGLAEPYRSAIVLRYLEELPPRKIALQLEVPVETVRTRVKRGLEQLRGELDRAFDGDRQAWGLALVPWAQPALASATTKASTIALTASVLVLGTLGGGWAFGAFGAFGTSGAAETAEISETAKVPETAAPIVVGSADPRDSEDPPRRIEPREAGGSPNVRQTLAGKLHLSASLERATVAPHDAVVLKATFENRGKGPVKFFTPEHLSMRPFPEWRLTADDGTVFRPAARPFQSMWTTGIQGHIRVLAPQQRWSSIVRANRFTRVDAKLTNRSAPETLSLPPGRYRVNCTYRQQTTAVPIGEPMFKLSKKKIAGLWTGTATAPDLWFAVTGPTNPSLTVHPVTSPVAGSAVWLELTIRNPELAPLPLGKLHLSVHVKAQGGGSSIVPPAAIGPADKSQGKLPASLVVKPRGTLRVRVDLALLSFASNRRGVGKAISSRFGLFELSSTGTMSCAAVWHLAGNRQPLRSGARIQFKPGRTISQQIELTVLPAGGARIQIRLTNVGAKPVRIRKRLSWPRDFLVSLVDAEQKRPSRRAVSLDGLGIGGIGVPGPAPLVQPLAWRGSRYEQPGPIGKHDFEMLPVGGALLRTLDLATIVSGPIPPGQYDVRVTWRSFTDGRHLGLEPSIVGVLHSQPVRLLLE